MSLDYDDSRFPLVTVTFEGASTDGDWDRLLSSLERTTHQAFSSGRRVVFVFDTRRGHVISASQRRRMGTWMLENDASSRATVAAFAFVIPSAIIRGTLTAILWIAPMPAPHRIFAEVGDAMVYAREQLAEAAGVSQQLTGT